MSLEVYPIQFPETPEGDGRPPLLLILDGSGLAFEYNKLQNVDRLVYGVSIACEDVSGDDLRAAYQTYLSKEFGSVDAYVTKLIRSIEEEILTTDDDNSKEFSLCIGGFSFGGYIAIELTSRLRFQPTIYRSDGSSVRLEIPSLILFDSYSPAAFHSPDFSTSVEAPPSLSKYPSDKPLVKFVLAHIQHSAEILKLCAPPLTEDLRKLPPVHYLRATESPTNEVWEGEGKPVWWTEDTLPTLNTKTIKVITGCGHYDIWNEEHIVEVTEWLRGVLNESTV